MGGGAASKKKGRGGRVCLREKKRRMTSSIDLPAGSLTGVVLCNYTSVCVGERERGGH